MHFHLPKPLHGWREFLGEVGIIVAGVLIALSAEQLVERWHARGEVARAEQNMRIEQIDDDLPQAYVRASIGICLRDQLGAIRALLDKQQVDRVQLSTLIDGYLPPIRTWDSQAWSAATEPNVAANMEPNRRFAWAGVYDVMPRLQSVNYEEFSILSGLQGIRRLKGSLSGGEAADISQKVAKLQALNSVMAKDSKGLMASAAEMGAEVPAAAREQLDRDARRQLGTCVTVPTPHVTSQDASQFDHSVLQGHLD